MILRLKLKSEFLNEWQEKNLVTNDVENFKVKKLTWKLVFKVSKGWNFDLEVNFCPNPTFFYLQEIPKRFKCGNWSIKIFILITSLKNAKERFFILKIIHKSNKIFNWYSQTPKDFSISIALLSRSFSEKLSTLPTLSNAAKAVTVVHSSLRTLASFKLSIMIP